MLSKRNFRTGDIVILKEVSNRNESKLAKVIDVYNDENGHVRSVQLYVSTSDSDHLLSRVLVRPIDNYFASEDERSSIPDRGAIVLA